MFCSQLISICCLICWLRLTYVYCFIPSRTVLMYISNHSHNNTKSHTHTHPFTYRLVKIHSTFSIKYVLRINVHSVLFRICFFYSFLFQQYTFHTQNTHTVNFDSHIIFLVSHNYGFLVRITYLYRQFAPTIQVKFCVRAVFATHLKIYELISYIIYRERHSKSPKTIHQKFRKINASRA